MNNLQILRGARVSCTSQGESSDRSMLRSVSCAFDHRHFLLPSFVSNLMPLSEVTQHPEPVPSKFPCSRSVLDRPWDKSTRAVVYDLPDVISPAGTFILVLVPIIFSASPSHLRTQKSPIGRRRFSLGTSLRTQGNERPAIGLAVHRPTLSF